MKYLSVVNLERRQHYKDRSPPWIKLHADVLDDYAFVRLHDASKAHLMLLWVLASKLENKIPYDPEFIAQRLGCTDPIDIQALVDKGFISVGQDASTPLAERKQDAPLVEERRGREEKRRMPASQGAQNWVDDLQKVWSHRVGSITHGRLGKALKDLHDQHGTQTVLRAMNSYISAQKVNDKPCKVTWFAEGFSTWEKRGPICIIDGEMSPELDALTKP
jgi:hypothetical protein